MRMILLVAATLLLIAGNLFFGAIHIPPADVVTALTGDAGDGPIRFIVLESRLPQALTALLAGAALASSGLMLQTVFRNPLAGPSILGITSGESLGGGVAVTAGALAGSFAVMLLLIALSARIRNNLTLLITGMMAGYLASSLVTLLSSISTAQSIRSYVVWGMGTFSGVSMSQMPWFALLVSVGLLMSMLLAKPLNLLLLGDSYAANLGVDVRRVRHILLLATGLLSAVVTACCGPIGFIGLAMPHIARMLFRTDNHLVLMPATMLCGAILALLCNLLSVLPDGNVIPVNALTPIAGVPVVIYVILKARGR